MCNLKDTVRNTELFVFDIYIAILKIKETSGRFTDVQNMLYDYNAWDSVIREFEIIGEASKHLLKNNLLDKEYQVVVDFRNQITHEYFGIDREVVWTIIYHDLPTLEDTILKLIQNIEPKLKDDLIRTFIEDNAYLDFVVRALERYYEK